MLKIQLIARLQLRNRKEKGTPVRPCHMITEFFMPDVPSIGTIVHTHDEVLENDPCVQRYRALLKSAGRPIGSFMIDKIRYHVDSYCVDICATEKFNTQTSLSAACSFLSAFRGFHMFRGDKNSLLFDTDEE